MVPWGTDVMFAIVAKPFRQTCYHASPRREKMVRHCAHVGFVLWQCIGFASRCPNGFNFYLEGGRSRCTYKLFDMNIVGLNKELVMSVQTACNGLDGRFG